MHLHSPTGVALELKDVDSDPVKQPLHLTRKVADSSGTRRSKASWRAIILAAVRSAGTPRCLSPTAGYGVCWLVWGGPILIRLLSMTLGVSRG